jgi:hypothetical protein
MRLTCTGTALMLMHNERLASPLNPYARRLAELTATRGKTEELLWQIARLEFDARTAAKIVDGYAQAVAPGSYLVISIGSGDQELADEYRPHPLYNHPAETIRGWVEDLELLDPGVADAREWLTEPRSTPAAGGRGRILTAIARTPPAPATVHAGAGTE